jgi:hypothetical protein
MKIKALSLLSAAVLVLALGSTAKADSFTLLDSLNNPEIIFTGSVTASTVTLTIECVEAACQNWYLGDVTLKGFTYTGTPTLGSAPSGYTLIPGGQDNNAVGTGGGCNSTQIGSALCWDAGEVPLTVQLGLNNVLTFTANLPNNDGAGGLLHVQATGYGTSAGTQQGGNKVFAVSNDLTGGSSQVPEPGSLALFGTGALGLAGYLRRKLFA